jgi:hypothetical protein
MVLTCTDLGLSVGLTFDKKTSTKNSEKRPQFFVFYSARPDRIFLAGSYGHRTMSFFKETAEEYVSKMKNDVLQECCEEHQIAFETLPTNVGCLILLLNNF